MSLLTKEEIKECILIREKDNTIRWKNRQEYILCLECEQIVNEAKLSMMYKCESIDSYKLHCVCTDCVKTHLTKMNLKRNYDKIQVIKKENRNQEAIIKAGNVGIPISKNPYKVDE